MKSVSKEEAIRASLAAFKKPMTKVGITHSYLAKKLKSELCAKETKVFHNKDTREILYSKPFISWDVRQKARMDAHKLRGDYPPEETNLKFPEGIPEFKVIFDKGKGNGSGEP
jgi:hypothetical protein